MWVQEHHRAGARWRNPVFVHPFTCRLRPDPTVLIPFPRKPGCSGRHYMPWTRTPPTSQMVASRG